MQYDPKTHGPRRGGNEPAGDWNEMTGEKNEPARPREGRGRHVTREEHAARQKTYKRRRIAALAGLLALLLLLSWGVTVLVDGRNMNIPISGSAVSTVPPSPDNDGTSEEEWNFIGPVEQTINPPELVTPDYRMIALPENGRVDMSYFNTVTFVGDSITQGMQIYPTGISNANYCAYKNIGPRGIYDGSVYARADGVKEQPMEALVASAPDNVYILLGANVLGSQSDEAILTYYREMMVEMCANLLPGVYYYIQSITPIRPDNARGVTKERITDLNNALAKMAYEMGFYFLDLHEVLAGPDGYLKEEFDSHYDGFHLTQAAYTAWTEYLVTHTAYHPRNPYLPGSPYGPPI